MVFREKLKDESGFMGRTHALSAVAFYLLLAGMFPTFIFDKILQTQNLLMFVASIFIVAGAVSIPDFDSVKSTAISTLGVLGELISSLMRSFAVMMFFTLKTKKDGNEANPHRGFWHTLIAVIFVFFIVLISVSSEKITTLPYLNKDVTIGFLFACFWIFISIKLALAGLFAKYIKKLKKGFIAKVILNLFTLGISLSVLFLAPSTLNYEWIAYCIALGYLFHLFGDMLTVSGDPFLWPIKIEGKRWYNIRLLTIRAGGTTELMIFTPIFLIVIIMSLVKVVYYLIG